MTLLRPHQREEMQTEKQALESKLKNPYIQDKGAVGSQLRKLNKQLETQTPTPFKDTEVDAKVRREKELREELLNGMPSQEEMRKAPPGAIGKHMEWEKKNKKKLVEWKETRLRLNPESDDPDIANFERYRPTRSSLNMDNAQIPGKQYYLPTEAYIQGYDQINWGNHSSEPEITAKGEDTVIQVEMPASDFEKETTPVKKGGWTKERREAHSKAMKERHAKRKAEE